MTPDRPAPPVVRPSPARQTWQAASNAWATHVLDCAACTFTGQPCSENDRQLGLVVSAFAAVGLDDKAAEMELREHRAACAERRGP